MVCVRETFSTTSDTRFAAANQRCTPKTPPDLRFPIVELAPIRHAFKWSPTAFPLRATATAFIAMSKIRPLCENEKSSSEAWLSRKRSPDTRSTPKELFSAITIKRGQIQCVAFLTERVVEGITHTQNSQNTQKHTHTIVILTLLSVVFGARTDFCFAETQKDISSLTNCVRGCGQCCRVTRPCPAAAPRPVCRRHFRMSFTTVNTNQHSPTTQHN